MRTPEVLLLGAALGLTVGCTGTYEDLAMPRDPTEKVPDAAVTIPLTVVSFDADGLASGAPDYAAKLAAVGEVLSPLGADVVLLSGIDGDAALGDLASGPLASAGYAARFASAGNGGPGSAMGVLAKRPPDAIASHADDELALAGSASTYRYANDCLEVRLTLGSRHLALFGVAFRGTDAPDDPGQRLAEAQHTRALADLATSDDPNLAALVAGNFEAATGTEPFDAVATSEAGDYQDAAGLATPPSDAWTFDDEGQHLLLDHQLASATMAGLLDPLSVKIPHGAAAAAASRHSPVAATFQVH